jgi:ketosteroid isomerase-like protein
MKLRVLASARVLLALLAFVILPRSLPPAPGDGLQTAILAVLANQKDAWNRGNVAEFMNGYWNSPELTFAGARGITRGWQPVLDRYRKNYPDQHAMGHLDFSDVEVRSLGTDAALVLGRWHLTRDADELGGVFTLVFQHFSNGWKIIHDHTSADAKRTQ